MKVRAKQDGHYGGHYRLGPYEDDFGSHEGEVFEIDATPHAKKDERGNPIQKMEPTGEISPLTGQLVMKKVWVMDGKNVKKDSDGQPIPIYEMATSFSPTWMDAVNEDATITYAQFAEPLGVLPQMREPSKKAPSIIAAKTSEVPAEIKALLAEREKSPI